MVAGKAHCITVMQPSHKNQHTNEDLDKEYKSHYAHEKEIYMGLISSSEESLAENGPDSSLSVN